MELKTKSLRIVPLNIDRMALLCEGQDKLNHVLGLTENNIKNDEHLQTAYREMYQNCLSHENDYLWYTNWQIILKSENKSIGSIGFKGTANERHEVEIGYGINEEYNNQGYATEAMKALIEWAFTQKVYYIQAQIEPDNEPSKKVLQKCGFKQIESKNDNLLFELEKPASAWMSIYMCLGMSVGMCFGIAGDNLAIGLSTGMALGVAVGLALDADDKKKRKRN